MAFLKSEGTVPDSREVFMILTKVGNKGSTHSFTILVGMGSSWHDLVGALSMIFFRSSADMGGKYVSLGEFLSSCDVSSIPCCAFTIFVCNFCVVKILYQYICMNKSNKSINKNLHKNTTCNDRYKLSYILFIPSLCCLMNISSKAIQLINQGL